MLSLLAALALAAELPNAEEGPYEIARTRSGDLVVLDATGARLPTRVALGLAEGPDAVERFATNRRTRKGVAFGMWILGGVASGAGYVFALSERPEVALPLVFGGAGTYAAGNAVLYRARSERLDHWTTRERLTTALSALPADDADPLAPVAHATPWIEVDGVPWTRSGPVSVPTLADALDDPALADRFVRWRQSRMTTFGGLLAGGTVATASGVVVGVTTNGPEIRQAALATAGLGAVALGSGVVGLVLTPSRARADRWLTPEELDRATLRQEQKAAGSAPAAEGEGGEVEVGADARGEVGAAAGSVGAARWVSVMPVLAPGWVGLRGTF